MFGAETPINTSAPTIASLSIPVTFSGFVICANSAMYLLLLKSLSLLITPLISHITIFLTPEDNNNLQIAVPAEPAPLITTFILVKSFFTTFKALINPDKTTIAVPC